MKRLGARELKVGMKVQWRKGRVTNPEICEIVAVEESRTGKIRIRLGPLTYAQYRTLMPDRRPFRERKMFFELAHLVRTYVGPELDFDVQLVLRADEAPELQLPVETGEGPQLGWNSWLPAQSFARDVGDAVFEGVEIVQLGRHARGAGL